MSRSSTRNRSTRNKYRSTSTKSVTPRHKESIKSLPIIRGILFLFLLVGFFTFVLHVPWQDHFNKLEAMTQRPVKHIVVEGDIVYVSKQTLKERLSEALDGNFVDIDLREVKANLESLPWVQTVTLKREWPDKLTVTVKEHRPIARWHDPDFINEGFINEFGGLVEGIDNVGLQHLPLLKGEKDLLPKVVRYYLDFSQILSANQLSLSGLSVDAKQTWIVEVDGQFKLYLGAESVIQKMKNFATIYKAELHERKTALRRVDLRYQGAVAVKFEDKDSVNPVLAAQ